MTQISRSCMNMLIKHVAEKISRMQRTIWKHFLSTNSDGFLNGRTHWKRWDSYVLSIQHLKMRNAQHSFRKDVQTPTGRIFSRSVWIMSFVEVVIICFLGAYKDYLTQNKYCSPIYPSNSELRKNGSPVSKWFKVNVSSKGINENQNRLVLLLCAVLDYDDISQINQIKISWHQLNTWCRMGFPETKCSWSNRCRKSRIYARSHGG